MASVAADFAGRFRRDRGQPYVSLRMVGLSAAFIELFVMSISNVLGYYLYHMIFYRIGTVSILSVYVSILTGVIFVLSAYQFGLYSLVILKRPYAAAHKIVFLSLASSVFVSLILFLTKGGDDFSRGSFLAAILLQPLGLLCDRVIGAYVVRSLLELNIVSPRRAVVIEEETAALSFDERSGFLVNLGFEEAGHISLGGNEIDIRRDIFSAISLSHSKYAEAFVLFTAWNNTARLASIVACLRGSSLPVKLMPDAMVRSVLALRTFSSPYDYMAVDLQRHAMTDFDRFLKRSIDIFVSLCALLILAPLLLFVAIIVKINSQGPVFFRQRRGGINQKDFMIWKFRTMTVLEDGEFIRQVHRNDHRLTTVGKILRRTSIDELPQLFNVFKGDMSLVGPRPHALAHDKFYRELIDSYCIRHRVKPGITGWAQVNRLRGETKSPEDMKARVELDVWYIKNWSLRLDLWILLRTAAEVIRHDAV